MLIYLTFGLVFYIGMSIYNCRSFKNATMWQVIKGLMFGIPLWPLALIFVLNQIRS